MTLHYSNDDIAYRPRLEPSGTYGTGPGPLNPMWAQPAPVPEPSPLEALHTEVQKMLAECRRATRLAHENGVSPVGAGELAFVHDTIALVQRLQAEELHHNTSSRDIAGWTPDLLSKGVIHAPGDLIVWLAETDRVLGNVIEARSRAHG